MSASPARIVAWGVGGLVLTILVLVGAAVAALLLLDWNIVKPYAQSAIGGALGRDVTLETLDVDLGATSTIYLRGLRIANPAWAKRKELASVKELRIGLHTWPLLVGRVEVTEARAEAPVIDLERNAEAQTTWDLGTAADTTGEVVAPDSRDEFPEIGRLVIEGGLVRYDDAVRGVTLEGDIATVTGEAEGGDRVELVLKGQLEEQPLTLSFNGGSFKALRDTEKPFPVELRVQFADTELTVKGTMREPMQMRDLDLEIALQGPSLAQLYPLLGIPLQSTRPYRLSGALKRDGELWRVADLHGDVGDSDLSGEVALDNTKEPPFLKADLVSNKLVFTDLAGLIGVDTRQDQASGDKSAANEAQKPDKGSVFPQTDIVEERLRVMDMDVTFEGKEVIGERLPIHHLSAHLRLTDGRVEVKPLKLDVAGGTISGEAALNVRGKVPSADTDLSFDALDLKPFFQQTQFVQEMGGRFSGHLYLLGEGENLEQMMASARGEGWVGMRDGTISGLVVEGIGLDVAEALVLAVGGDSRVAIRCARIDLNAEAGTFTAKRAIIDTDDSTILAQGSVNLEDETMDLRVEARPKDFSLIDMAAPVALSGSFKEPSVSIGDLDPLPFLEVGQAKDLDCGRLMSGKLSPAEVPPD